MPQVNRPYFVTGAHGCIGAWVVKLLVERGDRPWVADLAGDPRRLRLILSAERLADVTFLQTDITDFDAVERALAESGAQHIIHLAGLQVPFCKADPALGAKVNVLGTVHVFEAALRAGVPRVVYASSAAVYGPGDAAVDESVVCEPTTHYGVYKCANEGNARVYFQDSRISSVGLRPLTVYGVCRDQGLTSDITKAMKAAVVDRSFTVRFSGRTDLIHVRDAAWAFIEAADRAPDGAFVFNLHGDSVAVRDAVDLIHANAGNNCVEIAGDPLPIPPGMIDASIGEVLGELPRTPFEVGVVETMDHFRVLREEGRLTVDELDV